MNQTIETQGSAAAPSAASISMEHEMPAGFGEGIWGKVAFGVAIIFATFQIVTALSPTLPSQVIRSMHVGFLLLLGFGLFANLRAQNTLWRMCLWGLGGLGFLTGIYQWVFYEPLLLRYGGFLETQDIVVGIVLMVLVFEATRRMMGIALPLIALAFLAYGFYGEYLPQPFGHRGYDIDQLVEHLSFGTEGIYGTAVYVSASYIFIFVVFASFLERAGMLALFNDFALGLVGAARGGPAQVCVLSSALMGTISGSGVANVVASGQFTIPLMKRFGFRSSFAGGVEAMSSMGGQIMPPVMGAVAFIMAETLGVSYAEVVWAAIVPAFLYFASAFLMVWLEAGRHKLLGIPESELPNPWDAVRKHWPLVLPLAALVYLLFAGYTPMFAGTMGLALTVILILGQPVSGRISPLVLRTIFWVFVGVGVAVAFRGFGVVALLPFVVFLVGANALFRGGRDTLRLCIDSLAEGAKNALAVGIACSMVGVIIGTLTLTGAATSFGSFVVQVGQHSLFLSLLLTMLTCLVLGMGIPTIPNYIITSAIAGPALLELGVPLIVSHMFVFYFGIMADLTPPVALAAFAAAPMAKESGLKIGIQATKIAAAGFVVPYMAVYTPQLMLQPGGPLEAAIGFWPAVVYILFKTLVAMALWGAAATGYLFGHLRGWQRILMTAAAFLLVASLPWTDELGFALAVALSGFHFWQNRKVVPA